MDVSACYPGSLQSRVSATSVTRVRVRACVCVCGVNVFPDEPVVKGTPFTIFPELTVSPNKRRFRLGKDHSTPGVYLERGYSVQTL